MNEICLTQDHTDILDTRAVQGANSWTCPPKVQSLLCDAKIVVEKGRLHQEQAKCVMVG